MSIFLDARSHPHLAPSPRVYRLLIYAGTQLELHNSWIKMDSSAKRPHVSGTPDISQMFNDYTYQHVVAQCNITAQRPVSG